MFVARASWHICSRQPTGLSGGQDQSQRQIYIIEPLITVIRCSQLWSGENLFPKDVLLGKPVLNRRRLRVARVSQCEKVLSCSSFKTVFYWMNFKIFLLLFLELGIAVCPFTVGICTSWVWKTLFLLGAVHHNFLLRLWMQFSPCMMTVWCWQNSVFAFCNFCNCTSFIFFAKGFRYSGWGGGSAKQPGVQVWGLNWRSLATM